MRIIKTKDRAAYRHLYYPFLEKHFGGEGFTAQLHPSCRESPFHFVGIGLDDEEVKSHMTVLVTSEKVYQEFLAGKLKENEITPYTPGSDEPAYLYWPSLVIENRRHAPYLLRSVFTELRQVCAAWELKITHVYSIAFTKVSERLMRRYSFAQVGLYQGKYPIMSAKVAGNTYLSLYM